MKNLLVFWNGYMYIDMNKRHCKNELRSPIPFHDTNDDATWV